MFVDYMYVVILIFLYIGEYVCSVVVVICDMIEEK